MLARTDAAALSHAERLHALFAGNEATHGTHGEPRLETKADGTKKYTIRDSARTVRSPATTHHWRGHLGGSYPLGINPRGCDDTCICGVIDIDQAGSCLALAAAISKLGLPLIPTRSKSDGCHLTLFLKGPEPAEQVRAALTRCLDALGLPSDTEIFPTQAKWRDGSSGWVTMPYLGTTYGGRLAEQSAIKPSGLDMTIDEFLLAAEGARTTTAELVARLPARSKQQGSSSPRYRSTDVEAFADGPPCLQQLTANGPLTDGRKRFLFAAAIYHRRRDEVGLRAALEDTNQEYCSPPLDAALIRDIVRSVEKKSYNYKCGEAPLCGACDRTTCKTRRYGINSDVRWPKLARIIKIISERPRYRVEFKDLVPKPGFEDAVETDDYEKITNYRRFNALCGAQLGQMFDSMKEADWTSILKEVPHEAVEEDRELTDGGRFEEHLRDFLVNRHRGECREDILSGKPWEDEEARRHYFRLEDLEKTLDRHSFRPTRPQMRDWIKHLGGGKHSLRIGDVHRVWWVPAEKFRPAPASPLRGMASPVI